ncbi:hypothetical protein NPIL_399551 [Nephila pilipes]|uniref:Uncharacterized protein n=1 Tax=Nephila pilipes TaxID=299642 RepID=A0A8X6TEY5_NEPPI|nr:hypothetical protein NPIL_399551 [Nephila pilipes]
MTGALGTDLGGLQKITSLLVTTGSKGVDRFDKPSHRMCHTTPRGHRKGKKIVNCEGSLVSVSKLSSSLSNYLAPLMDFSLHLLSVRMTGSRYLSGCTRLLPGAMFLGC